MHGSWSAGHHLHADGPPGGGELAGDHPRLARLPASSHGRRPVHGALTERSEVALALALPLLTHLSGLRRATSAPRSGAVGEAHPLGAAQGPRPPQGLRREPCSPSCAARARCCGTPACSRGEARPLQASRPDPRSRSSRALAGPSAATPGSRSRSPSGSCRRSAGGSTSGRAPSAPLRPCLAQRHPQRAAVAANSRVR
jgi:hypothetical protein